MNIKRLGYNLIFKKVSGQNHGKQHSPLSVCRCLRQCCFWPSSLPEKA